MHADVVIIGSGFAGSLLGAVLARQGLQVVVLDREAHPRFAIGESSTPIANLILRELCRRYDLPKLTPLGRYGSWRDAYPNVLCGEKRGFSYYNHQRTQQFQPTADHANELMVAASSSSQLADTHWYRANVDQLFAECLTACGGKLWERTVLERLERSGRGWRVTIARNSSTETLHADFLVDASGRAAVVPRFLHQESAHAALRTTSATIFGHFLDVEELPATIGLSAAAVGAHPYPCESAAVHHLLGNAWMWQLRFSDGRLSAGIAMPPSALGDEPLDQQWQDWLQQFPTLGRMFRNARHAPQPGRLMRSDRLQHWWPQSSGENWALLPHTAGFVDPMHSSGIALSLAGVERLAEILVADFDRRPELLDKYTTLINAELKLIDRLVSGSYRAMTDFRLFSVFVMTYFAAATTCELRRSAGKIDAGRALFCADDKEFVQAVASICHRLDQTLDAGVSDLAAITSFQQFVQRTLRPYNQVGLCDPAAENYYHFVTLDD